MPLNEKFLKPYDPQEAESRIYKLWEDSGFFNPDNLPGKRENAFTIVMPPPNVTGVLHMGHALMLTLEDIMIRYKRMCGFKTLWLPGTDHASIATQARVEKDIYKTEKKSRHDLGRDEFLKRVEAFAQQSHDTITSQIRVMGASCDWSREAFTLDEKRNLAVRTMFKMMYDDGLIYRGHRIVNWDPKGQTTISDDEIVYQEEKTVLYYMQYGPFTIATSRPETKFGDKYVCMHPDDKRYAQYKNGQKIDLEWINGPITATIVKDDAIEMEFGSGVMTITPWHDNTDFEIAERHNLPREQVIDEYGKLLPIAGEFSGMKIADARPKVVEKLRTKGLLVKEEPYTHNLATAERTGGIVEPQIKLQWFVNVNKPIKERENKTLKDLMREAVKSGDIKILPEHFEKTYFHWIENLRDWCISRQIWYGHRVPVWYCGQTVKRMGFAGDIVTQVFDTKTRTYRLRDHGFSVGERVAFENSVTKRIFGYGTITEIKITTVGEIDLQDKKHWKTYEKRADLIAAFKRHHPKREVNDNTQVWIYTYEFDGKIPEKECGEIIVSEKPLDNCPTCGGKSAVQDPDTLDTWFSSGLWTFSTLGWPEKTKDLGLYHPTDVLETGYEILFFWIARMVLMTKYALGTIPFRTVYLHGTVRDGKGRKMSKSLGNGIDPIDVAKKFGTDAGRMALIIGNTPGTDTNISEDKIRGYKNFANKLWNIARFTLENTEGVTYDRDFDIYTEVDTQLRKERHDLTVDITKDIEEYRFYMSAEKIYHYIWHNLADKIIEDSKSIFKDGDEHAKLSRKQFLLHSLREILIILHPFMPFVTEEIWQTMPARLHSGGGNEGLLMVEQWPTIPITNQYEYTNTERKNDES